MAEDRCRGCNRAIRWAKTPKGANVPVETVQTLIIDEHGRTQPAGQALVNHFLTCPKANQFSGKNR
jgi:hypothetical protein